MSRWLKQQPGGKLFRYTEILASRADMVEVSDEKAKTQEAPAHEQEEPPDMASGGEENEGLAAHIDDLDQEELDAFAEDRIGERPKHNLSLANQRLWTKQMLGLKE